MSYETIILSFETVIFIEKKFLCITPRAGDYGSGRGLEKEFGICVSLPRKDSRNAHEMVYIMD